MPGGAGPWSSAASSAVVVGRARSLLAATVDHDGINHLLRAYLLGYMICFGFAAAAWRC